MNRNDAWDKPLHLNDILNSWNTEKSHQAAASLFQPNCYVRTHTAHTSTGTTHTTDHYYTSLIRVKHIAIHRIHVLFPFVREYQVRHIFEMSFKNVI